MEESPVVPVLALTLCSFLTLSACLRAASIPVVPSLLSWLASLSTPLSSYVESCTRRIATVATSSKIVVEKSTVPCRTAQSMRTILEANSRPNCRFDILSNPEFLAEGTAINDLMHPDRVLIGSLSTPEGLAAQAALVDVYANWVPRNQVVTTGLWSSELTKLVSRGSLRFLASPCPCAALPFPGPRVPPPSVSGMFCHG